MSQYKYIGLVTFRLFPSLSLKPVKNKVFHSLAKNGTFASFTVFSVFKLLILFKKFDKFDDNAKK